MLKKNCHLSIQLLLLFILSTTVLASSSFTGKVVKITDGDTIQVMHNSVAEKIRLDGIDCPESSQAYGNKAKEFTKDFVASRVVTVEVKTKDKYGRTVGEVFRSDGMSLNQELVRAGYAWHYKKYSNDPILAELEEIAKFTNAGLWADPNPTAPWDWRKSKKISSESSSTQKTASSLVVATSGEVHGNKKSYIYHQPSCQWFNCKNCTAIFSSASSAQKAGYRGCKKCN